MSCKGYRTRADVVREAEKVINQDSQSSQNRPYSKFDINSSKGRNKNQSVATPNHLSDSVHMSSIHSSCADENSDNDDMCSEKIDLLIWEL